MAESKLTRPEEFCRSFDWILDWKKIWKYDRTGIYQIDGARLAKVELSTYGTAGQYEGFRVTVINKVTGKVDEKFFRFDDYLDPSLDARTDGRKDYPIGGNRCFEVVYHCGWDWYIARPRTTRPFCQAVESYVESFR
jgi:hypothetical protein